MDQSLVVFVMAVVALVALNLLASRFGVDSRHKDGAPDLW